MSFSNEILLTDAKTARLNTHNITVTAGLMFVLLIIGALTLTGKMTGIAAGATIVGLSATLMLIAIQSCMIKGTSKKVLAIAFIIGLVGTTLGGLALKGTLPISDAAWSMCGPIGGIAALSILAVSFFLAFRKCYPDHFNSLLSDISEDHVVQGR